MSRTQAKPGSISEATLRLEDLIPCFLQEIQELDPDNLLIVAIEDRMEKNGYYKSDESDYDFDVLFDALQEYAPPHFYFGAHPGDGADYGFWACDD